MKRSVFFTVLAVVMLAFFAFSSGCGGSSSSDSPSSDTPSGSVPAQNSGTVVGNVIRLGFDDDNDNKPDVLDFDGVQQLYINSSGSEVAGVVPFMVWMKKLATQSSPDIITANLDAGTAYSVEVSKNFAEYLGARIPDVEIADPNGNVLSDVTLTTYPKSQPSMIICTFTPQTSGTYTIRVCNADGNTESDSDTDSVVFVYKEMHNSKGENGYYARFVLSNADGSIQSEASMNEVIQLRKNFIEDNPFYLDEVYGQDNDNGTRNRNNEGGEDITQSFGGYESYEAIMKSKVGIYDDEDDEDSASSAEFSAAAADESTILSMITGIPYDADYVLGRGFKGITNMPARSLTALEAFELPVRTTRTGSTHFTYSFISSREEYEKKMGNNFSFGGTKGALGGSLSVQTTSNMKFGISSTTLVIHYDEMESTYRYLPPSEYKLTEDAQMYLDMMPDEFRDEYGDYFVAGYQYGGMYEAHITITTSTSEQLDKIKFQLGAKLRAMTASGDKVAASADVNFSRETQEILKKYNAQINVDIKTIGAGATTPTNVMVPNSNDIAAMDNVVGSLTKFRNDLAASFSPETYAPLNVMLLRYRSITGVAAKLPAKIPVPFTHSALINEFNGELVNMKCYYNDVSSVAAVRTQYSGQINRIVGLINAGDDDFYFDPAFVNEYLPKVRELSSKLNEVSDRYAFYRMLVAAQEQEAGLAGSSVKDQPFGPNGGSTGYKTFSLSDVVTEDLKRGGYFTKSSPNDADGWKTWKPELDAGAGKRICWISVTAPHDNDNSREVLNKPAVGKQKASFSFESALTLVRSNGDWKIEYQVVDMSGSLYPFVGLKD